MTVVIKDQSARTAKYFGDQGCVIFPRGETSVHFNPVVLESILPDPSTQPWPVGDVISPARVTRRAKKKLNAAMEVVFAPENHTAAFVVLHEGQIIAERYGDGAHMHMPLESWSMGKSLTAILYGLVVKDQGDFDPYIPAPIAEWRGTDDPRAAIRVADLMHMSSGLRFSSMENGPGNWDHAHPDHIYVYSGAINVFEFSASRPQEHAPDTVGRYRNCDPLLMGYIVKTMVETRGDNYLEFPRRALFDKLGIRNMVLETDAYGNFIMTGFDYGAARDWARLGLLMIQDGVWLGERLLPEGFADFVSTPAPAWKKPQYGGLFWVNGAKRWNLPESAYWMSGQGGQHVIIDPTHDLVVVRMGHQSGARTIGKALNAALDLIVEAIE